MTPLDMASTLEGYAQAKNDHDVDAILSFCADNCVYETVATGARARGHEALRVFYSALFEALPDYRGDFDGTAYSADSAVVWGRFGGTTSGQFMGTKVEAEREVEVPVTFVCNFRDGLLVGDRGYFDAATLAEQVGLPRSEVAGAGAGFVERFQDFWARPNPDRVADLLAPDAVLNWPGAGDVMATDYPQHIAAILSLVTDLRLEVTEYAEGGELVLISWRARASVAGEPLTWTGIDRFRIRAGRAIEGLVAFDSLALQRALQGAQ